MTEQQTVLDTLPPAAETEKQLSRRQFLKGAAAGGAAGLAVAVGTGVAAWTVADAKLQATVETANAEIARLEGLVALYEDLEKVGLDAILATGMQALSLPLAAVESGAQALKSGLEWAEQALLSIQEALPSAQESILWLEAQVSAVAEGLEKLETTLGTALNKAIRNPVGETVTDFANMLLNNLPFGLGDKFRDALTELADLLTSVDDLVAGVNTSFLEPLRERWFATEDGQGVEATFLTPLVENILDPLEAHLDTLASLADAWQQDLVAPTEQALAQREQIRQEIARYKEDHGLPSNI